MGNYRDVFKLLIKENGEKQVIIAIEELSELQKELCKALRYNISYNNLIEEMADVLIMLEQMKMYFNIDEDELKEKIKEKIERTIEREL